MNAYKKFGYFYDEVMASLNYDLWLEFIEEYLNPNDKVLDLACGYQRMLSSVQSSLRRRFAPCLRQGNRSMSTE